MTAISMRVLVSAMFATATPVIVMSVVPAAGVSLLTAPAWADDDDGGGDDGGGGGAVGNAGSGGSLGGGSSFGGYVKKKQRSVKTYKRNTKRKAAVKHYRAQPKAEPRAQLPVASPNEILVGNISEGDAARLVDNGFARLRGTIVKVGKLLATFRIPPRLNLRRAREQARRLLPEADVDFNHFFRQGYSVQSGGACKGEACRHFNLVGWRAEIASCNVTPEIGIVDTWVDRNHPALTGATITELTLPKENETSKGSGHGTSVAALLVGNASGPTPGLLPKARIVTINVFDTTARGDERTDAYSVAVAIDTLQKRGTQVINLSLAGPDNSVLKDAVADAANQGILLIAAAGNAGPRAAPAFPAAYDDVIAVTAVSESLKIYRRANQGKHIDLAAPGVQIPTAGNSKNVEVFSGSSFAAPFVTAAAAVLMASGKKEDIADLLKQGAKDLGAAGPDAVFGAGLVQFVEGCKTKT